MDEKENPLEKPSKDIKLTASVELGEKKLIVHYEIANESRTDIYVLDILPLYDLETMKPRVDINHSVIIWSEPDAVRLIRGLPPIPEEMDVTAYITPKASKIEPGKSLKRKLELPLPLVESCPYYPPVVQKEDEKYEFSKITTLKLYVDVVRSDVEGFEAIPVDLGDDLYHVKTPQLIADAERLYKRFDLNEIELLLYPGVFTRRI